MPGLEIAGLAATCVTHTNTGSDTVFVESKGVTRVLADYAEGQIVAGGGSQTIFVESYNVSLPGDAIASHDPCDAPDPPHCAATTNALGAISVFGT